MIANTDLVCRLKHFRLCMLLVLCAALLPLAACKKKEDAAAAAAAATAEAPKEEPPKEEPPVELKASWPAGQRLVQRMETITETEVQNPATQQPVKRTIAQVQELSFTALKQREGGGHEVEVETLAVIVTNKFGTNTTVFTTRSDPKQDRNNPLAAPLRKLIGGKVKYLTTADGKIEKLEGALQLRSKVGAAANPMAASLLADDAIKGWNTFHTGLPDKAVKLGDAWPFTRNQTFGPGSVNVDATNTFKGWEQRDGRKVALIESVGVITTKPSTGNSLVTITVEDGATTSGKAWFDPALGMIVESTTTSELKVMLALATGQSTASKVKVIANAKLTDAPNPGATAAESQPATPAPDPKPPAAKPAKKPKPAEKP